MLTDSKVRAAKPRPKQYKLYDRDGLYLLVTPAGSKLWRFRYLKEDRGPDGRRREGGQALGKYPLVKLAEARRRRDELRVKLAHGFDPAEERKTAQLNARSHLRNVVTEFYRQPGQPATAYLNQRRIERLLFPVLGDRHVDEINASELLDLFVEAIERDNIVETVRRTRSALAAVYRFAIIRGYTKHNPAEALRGATALRAKRPQRIAACTDPKRIGNLLRAVWAYEGAPALSLALRFLPYVFVRPGELRGALWDEVDLEAAIWVIPAERMKMDRPHHVPLSRQALELLHVAAELYSPAGLLFPGLRDESRPLSVNALNVALRTAGIAKDEHTAHGFRSTASSELERLRWRRAAVELQLAHVKRDPVEGAYNRADLLDERREMMQVYADHLDALRIGAPVLAIGRHAM